MSYLAKRAAKRFLSELGNLIVGDTSLKAFINIGVFGVYDSYSNHVNCKPECWYKANAEKRTLTGAILRRL